MTNKVNVEKIIDEQQIGSFQVWMLLFSFLALIVDSYDAYSIAYVAPSIIAEWHVPRVAFTSVFTANVAGLALGAIVFGMVAARLGNRRVLFASMLLFGILTLAKAAVGSILWLTVFQFLAALPVGGIYPIALSIVAEHTPLRRRAAMLVIVALGFAFGASVAGFIAAPVIQHLGWRWMFYIGAVFPILLTIFTAPFVPESLRRLVQQGASRARVLIAVRRVAPSVSLPSDAAFVVAAASQRAPFKQLFADGRARMTLLLWAGFITAYLVYYFLFSWIPVLLNAAGMSINQSLMGGAVYPAGGFIAGLLFAYLSARRTVPGITCFFFVASALSLVSLGYVNSTLVAPVLFLIGAGSIGGILAGNALVSMAYPAELRTTGLGWAFGLGRFGSMLGPLLGGFMLEMKLPLGAMCMVLAVPALLSAIAFYQVGKLKGQPGIKQDPSLLCRPADAQE
jgi:AAHS family 4-hydroxybenzoate transporter-like MFS transporter